MTRPDGVRPWTCSEVKTGPDREQWRRCRPRRLGGGLASPSGSCFHGEVNVSSPHQFLCRAVRCVASWENFRGLKGRVSFPHQSRIKTKRQQEGQTSYTGPREGKGAVPAPALADGAWAEEGPARGGVGPWGHRRGPLPPRHVPSCLSCPERKVGISVLEETHFKCFTAPGRRGCLLLAQVGTQKERLPEGLAFK